MLRASLAQIKKQQIGGEKRRRHAKREKAVEWGIKLKRLNGRKEKSKVKVKMYKVQRVDVGKKMNTALSPTGHRSAKQD